MKRVIMAALLAVLLLGASPSTASADTASRPYGGCAESWQAPHTKAASICRDRGWEIHVGPKGHGIVVSPRHIVRYLWLPQCRLEDGSGQRGRCTWNMTLPIQGNGKGRAYWVDYKDRVHFVKHIAMFR